MLRYQQAYQAAAQIIRVASQLFDTLHQRGEEISMRLSTAAMHRSSIGAILEQQMRLARTQTQVTTGKRFQTAAEDPVAATRAAALDRTRGRQRAVRAQFEHHRRAA